MRVFTRIRHMLNDNTEIRLEIEKIKNKLYNQDKNMEIVFRYLDELLDKQESPNPPRTRIGFKPDTLDGKVKYHARQTAYTSHSVSAAFQGPLQGLDGANGPEKPLATPS